MPASASSPASEENTKDKIYRCGTLTYTKAGLFILFAWLLMGNFCSSLMESVWHAILPLVLKEHGAPNFVIAIALTTIPQTMNFFLNPIISTVSDRFRGKRGRRIPFLLFSAPFISLFLALLGFSTEIGRWMYALISHWDSTITASGITVVLICVFIVFFRFFELFVDTIFDYLFNDVVPSAFLGRFISYFKMVGAISGALFHFFIFKYAVTHTSVIFLSAAVLYFVAITLMGLRVREGKYPPPDQIMDRKKVFSMAPFKTYFRECFSAPIFRRIFAYSALNSINGSINVFIIFMAFSIGMSVGDVGMINGMTAVGNFILMVPMGILVDKFHPLRVMLLAQAGYLLTALGKCVFLFHDFSPGTSFWLYLSLTVLYIPFFSANAMATMPLKMLIFPHEKYGQFCSANSMCAAAGMVLGGVTAGAFLDLMSRWLPDRGDFYYRFVPVWAVVFTSLKAAASILIYREWKRLGGDKDYKPPIKDCFAGYHEPTPA